MAVGVTLLSLLAASVAPATAQELSIDQSIIPANDPALQRFEQGKPADHPNPPERGAPEVTASGFDPATLPPIDSIDAQTDITVFLRKGVPDQLRVAAIRRAWMLDPAIRDFKGAAGERLEFQRP
jgi:hypothetical protein